MNHIIKQKSIISLILILLLSGTLPVQSQEQQHLNEFVRQSRTIVSNFSFALIRRCEMEVESIGLYAATEVCRITAPQVYYEYSVRNNIILNLVSLQPRNPVTGHADAWEQAGLLKMQKMLANGYPAKEIEIVELVQEPAQRYYRYMKPMIATEFCLQCHGTEQYISKDAADSMEFFYPNDKAMGYQLGDLIGAVSIKKIDNTSVKK